MSQISFFDGSQPLKITKPIRLIELFAGIGSQAKALERLGVQFEHYRVCEFDPYAVTSYNAIHGTQFETSDITTWQGNDLGICDVDCFTYLLTYSFPCQDLSLAGRQKGMQEGSETRSALLWEVKRLLEETKELPQILIMENVPQVASGENKEEFFKWINFLESLGYISKWQILNAKDYKVPQNRKRCFMVSWLGNYYYDFPSATPLKKVLRDLLQPECEIAHKYYLSELMLQFFYNNTKKQAEKGNGFKFSPTDGNSIARCVTTRAGGRMDDNFIQCEQVATLRGGKWDKLHDMSRRVYSPSGLSPTINTCGGGQLEPKIMTEPLKVIDYYNHRQINSDVVGMITTGCATTGSGTFLVQKGKSPIRKLTQKECWRLMDFGDEDYENARKALNEKFYKGKDKSGSQLYKQAGNSIVVNCLVEIFKQML